MKRCRRPLLVTEDNIGEFPKGTAIGSTITRDKYVKRSKELIAAVIEEIQSMFGGTSLDVSILLDTEAKAEGGRIGYQGGELVEDVSMQETIQPEGMPLPNGNSTTRMQ